MRFKWACFLGVILMFVYFEGHLSKACLEEERVALLQLRRFFNHPDKLNNWLDAGKKTDCCKWDSVMCNETTGRVQYLALEGTRDASLREWYLNASLISTFQELDGFELSGNSIAGFVHNGGLDKLSGLRNLKNIQLRDNMINNSILADLGALSAVDTINLQNNKLNGIVDISGWSSLQNLVFLDMSDNKIEKIILPKGLEKLETFNLRNVSIHNASSVFQSLSSFPSLMEVDLSFNNFSESTPVTPVKLSNNLPNVGSLGLDSSFLHISILQNIGAFISPKSLWMDRCQLKGTLTVQELEYLGNFSSVEELHLDESSLHVSLLQIIGAFTSLRILSMQHSQIENLLDFSGVDWSSLTKLESLDLGYSMFNNSILSSLGVLYTLKEIHLNDNKLRGVVDISGLSLLNNLERLDMSNNKMDKLIFLKGTRGWKNVSFLNLANVNIRDGSNLLRSLGSFPSLEEVDLSFNNFTESLPPQMYVAHFTNMKRLTLDGSSLHISLLQSISSFASLYSLSMSFCQINGILGYQEYLHNLANLEHLSLYSSSSHISILQIIPAFTSLKNLIMENCQLNGTLLDLPNKKNLKSLYLHDRRMMTSLEYLEISSCGLYETLSHQDGGIIYDILYHQHNLLQARLSHNLFKGEFPHWLLENNTGLMYLYLANNSLVGPVQMPIHPHINLGYLDISNNNFSGHIPQEVGRYFPNLNTLDLSGNGFNGTIPSSIGNMTNLYSLDLSFNELAGRTPELEGCTSLAFLVLSNNNLEGPLFSTKFNLTGLVRLVLDGNQLTGELPESLSNAVSLSGLYLTDNYLSGPIPRWLGNISSLVDIMISNNHLEGSIPHEFCRLRNLVVLDLSENNLSGNLPSCFSPPFIKQVHLSRNRLQGQLKDVFQQSFNLKTLDLGYNQLHGPVPTQINKLSALVHIILRNNNLTGEVPKQLCQLNQLRLVDFSHNNLVGQIPPCLDMTALHVSGDDDDDSPIQEYISPSDFSYVSRTASQPSMGGQETLDFTTKNITYSYGGKILAYMSGIDLSCNKLTGLIPHQMGNLTRIRSLNLSHNNLTGSIPSTFSKLKQIESLDLSYNNLYGRIPPQLVECYTLSTFSVAHNNLSGRTPNRVAQFGTFDESSYEGNPLLCGLPLNRSCDPVRPPPLPESLGEDSGFIDMGIFYMSFAGSYIIALFGVFIVLYVNVRWRRMWFYYSEKWMNSCFYFVVDNVSAVVRR